MIVRFSHCGLSVICVLNVCDFDFDGPNDLGCARDIGAVSPRLLS